MMHTGSDWEPPAAAGPYLPAIRASEISHALPTGLLARLLYQESHYRPDIISGQTISSAGAVGIAQIVPKWHPDVDPTNPTESISYAAGYLVQLQQQFGNWEKALAAYNWGWGNLDRHIRAKGRDWMTGLPKETYLFVTQILQDVPCARE